MIGFATEAVLLKNSVPRVSVAKYRVPVPPGVTGSAPAQYELAGVPGRWWSEGEEFVFGFRKGRLEAKLPRSVLPPGVFERVDADLYRTVSGRERGELLRLVRDESGAVVKMYWATYPFTRQPEIFGQPDG